LITLSHHAAQHRDRHPRLVLIHTQPRQEHIALANLERQGYVCDLPLLRVEKIRRRKAEVVSEPMFAQPRESRPLDHDLGDVSHTVADGVGFGQGAPDAYSGPT